MSVFAETFDLVGLHNVRCEKPTGVLTGQKHLEMDLPGGLGRAHLDVYAEYATSRCFTRLYHMRTGEVAWYATTLCRDGAA